LIRTVAWSRSTRSRGTGFGVEGPGVKLGPCDLQPAANDDSDEMSRHVYKGHIIELVPSREGYMWACQYAIQKTDKTEVDGFPDGNTYGSREEAESAALATAQQLIDSSPRT